MAKAVPPDTTARGRGQRDFISPKKSPKKQVGGWILLKDALALVGDAYQMDITHPYQGFFVLGGSWPAENMLYRALKDRKVRYRFARFEGGWSDEASQRPHLDAVWRGDRKAKINWQMSSAYLQTSDGFGTFYRIEVAREDVLKLLPEGYEAPMATDAEPTDAAKNQSDETSEGLRWVVSRLDEMEQQGQPPTSNKTKARTLGVSLRQVEKAQSLRRQR